MNIPYFAYMGFCMLSLVVFPSLSQKAPKKKPLGANGLLKMPGCCEEVKDLKVQIANLSSLLEELTKKQETDWVNVVMQVMKLEGNHKQVENRMTDAEEKYSEMNNRVEILQSREQAAQTQTQTTAGKRGRALGTTSNNPGR